MCMQGKVGKAQQSCSRGTLRVPSTRALGFSGEGILAVKGSKLTTIFTRDMFKSCRGAGVHRDTHGCVGHTQETRHHTSCHLRRFLLCE